MTLNQLNESEHAIARKAFLDCCGSGAWADRMTMRRPYPDLARLEHIAEELWPTLAERDWLEAFAAHPKIGDKKASAKWSGSEQDGMTRADEDTAAVISGLNEEYERKFGWIFIVCATGKSAEEMLQILTARLRNDPKTELRTAAAEQKKITRLRLEKLVAE